MTWACIDTHMLHEDFNVAEDFIIWPAPTRLKNAEMSAFLMTVTCSTSDVASTEDVRCVPSSN